MREAILEKNQFMFGHGLQNCKMYRFQSLSGYMQMSQFFLLER